MLYRNRRRKLSCPVKERYNLSTRARGIRTECTVVHTGGDAIYKRPVNSLGIVGVAADIHEAAVASCGLTVRSPEEGHNLRARNSRIGAEGGSTGAGSDAVLDGPQDCVIVVIARVNVRERILVQHRCRASSRSPQERHNLRTGAGYIRAEGITAGAAGDTLVDSPLHSIVVIVAEGNIGKRQIVASDTGDDYTASEDGIVIVFGGRDGNSAGRSDVSVFGAGDSDAYLTFCKALDTAVFINRPMVSSELSHVTPRCVVSAGVNFGLS